MITISMVFCVFAILGNNTYHPYSDCKISVDVYLYFLPYFTHWGAQAFQNIWINTLWIISINIIFLFSVTIWWTPYLKIWWTRYWQYLFVIRIRLWLDYGYICHSVILEYLIRSWFVSIWKTKNLNTRNMYFQ